MDGSAKRGSQDAGSWSEAGRNRSRNRTPSLTIALVIGLSAFTSPPAIAQPTMLDPVVTQIQGGGHTCALTSTGGVKCWGQNFLGQLGNGTTTPSSTPVDVSGLTSGVAQIGVNGNSGCALTIAGGVKCWGQNDVGQLGNGTNTNAPFPVDVVGLGSGVAAISTSGGTSCAMTTSGEAKCWGSNAFGRLGDGTTSDRNTPVTVTGLTAGIAFISTGGHTCAVTRDGGAKCWGLNQWGELGDGTLVSRTSPGDVSGLTSGVASIAVGGVHACALTDVGAVKCWGNGTFGQLGNGPVYIYQQTTPVDVVGLSGGVESITAADHNCAVTSAGGLKCWGRNDFGELGDGTKTTSNSPVDVLGLTWGVAAAHATALSTCALTVSGGVKCWGNNGSGRLGDGTTIDRLTATDVAGLAQGLVGVAAGEAHTCGVTAGGGAKCWGNNNAGQLGDGSEDDHLTPTDVLGLNKLVASIAVGGFHSCSLGTEGGVKCWGQNLFGQLGDGTTDESSTAVDVPGLSSGVVSVSAGSIHTCALSAGGGVKCWGANSSGQIGDGTTVYRTGPTDVPGLTSGVLSVSAGRYHTCALMPGGAVKCWGSNSFGQVGDGTTTNRVDPTDVAGLSSGVVSLASGANHTCALLTGGGVKCWGQNAGAALGDGTTQDRWTPVDVTGLSSGVASLSGGLFHTCAVTTAGGAKCWGYSQSGQVGTGAYDLYPTAVDVQGLTEGVASIHAGLLHTCALMTDGGLRCWGNGGNGRLGDGTGLPRPAPVGILLGQTIAFTAPVGLSIGVATPLTATSSSGLPVTFDTWTPGTCSVVGNTVTATAAVWCGIRASQAGNANNAPASQQLRLIAAVGAPTVTTDAATDVTESTATLNGTVNPNGLSTSASYQYGLSNGYGSTTAAPSIGFGVAGVSLPIGITGLACNTLYHFRATATSSAGTANGSDLTFTTSTCPPPPTVTTDPVSDITQTGATLKGTINPNNGATNRRFEYGLTIGYGLTSPNLAIGHAVSPVAVGFVATGLACNTLYHYRAVGQSNGGTVNGLDMTFTTAACPAAGLGNIHASSARTIAVNSSSRDSLSTVRTEVWYRVRLFAGRSYQVSAWTVDEDGAVGVSPVSLSAFSDAGGTVAATPAPTVASGTVEGLSNDSPMFGQSMLFQPDTTDVYLIRILGSPSVTDTSSTVMVRETTLFSTWTSRAAGFEGFVEMHNNTNAPIVVTLAGYNNAGAAQGAGLTFTLPADATMVRTAAAVGVPAGTFAGIVLTHNGAFGAISANITTLNGANGLSFDSPFTTRASALPSSPIR